jgi:hypothetical protein
MAVTKKKLVKGFAWMRIHDPDRLREICKVGGTKSQAGGKAYRWGRDEAKRQAPVGGKARWRVKPKKTGTEG